MFSKLSDTDKERIRNYINHFANADGDQEPGSLEMVLTPWAEAKSEYLANLFGDSLIIEKEVEFKESLYELESKVLEYVYQDPRCCNFIQEIRNIYYNKYGHFHWDTPEYRAYSFISTLCNSYTLAMNAIDGRPYFNEHNYFDLVIGDNTVRIQKGMKPLRVITKIANAYNVGTTPDKDGVSDLEYFRRRHSQCLNTKALSGNLCLSIHPLDYMTMSDNDCGWDSCMSWENDGEYKQGTIEMLNSPCVVVGYLTADHNYAWSCGEKGQWNSKKWRSLFIVDKEFIINIKSYPYENINLTKTAITELGKLAGWGEHEPVLYEYIEEYDKHRRPHIPVEINNRSIALDFRTGCMYNDFGSGHYILLNPTDTHDIQNIHYEYSGVSECIWCGLVLENHDMDSYMLTCDSCSGVNYTCENCGDRIYRDDSYTTAEGYQVCPYCWEENTEQNALNGDYYLRNNMIEISLSSKNGEYTDDSRTIWVYEPQIDQSRSIWNMHFHTLPHEHQLNRWTTRCWLSPAECTPRGLELFDIYDEDDLQEYMGLEKD